MGRGMTAKSKKPRGLTEQEKKLISNTVRDEVMEQAYLMVYTAVVDVAETEPTKYFKSKKKMDEFLDEAAKSVEQYGTWIDDGMTLKMSDVAKRLIKRLGITWGSKWLRKGGIRV